MPDLRPAALSAALALVLAPLPQAQSVVSPADRATLEGSSSTTYPLGRFDHRLQQLHADLGTAARTISGHAYRRDALAQRDTVDAFSTELEVVIGAATLAPDQASSTFASNMAAGGITVLPRTTVSFPATQRPPSDPAATFDLRIPWTTPWQYPGTVPICLDITVHGNVTTSGNDRNFTPYADAHELYRDGRNVQPGYRFGDGCAANGSTTAHTARIELVTLADGSLRMDVDSRDGVPTSTAGAATTVLVLGTGYQPVDWPFKPGCRIYPTMDAVAELPGTNDQFGDWTGSLALASQAAAGMRFYAQLASGIPGTDLTMSDGNVLTVPPVAPATISAVRVASGSDRSSPTGTVSTIVPVTEFF